VVLAGRGACTTLESRTGYPTLRTSDSVDPDDKTVHLGNGWTFGGDALVVAPGRA
jgi:hypothetical protein